MGSSRELISHGHTGWLIPPRNEEALSSAIEAALTRGRAGLTAMGKHGKVMAQRYGIEAGVSRFVSAARSALAEAHTGAIPGDSDRVSREME